MRHAGHVLLHGRRARRSVYLSLLALPLVLVACGGKQAQPATTGTTGTTTASPTSTRSATGQRAPIKVTISSPTHHPAVNKPWPVKITVTDTSGKPLPARLTMRVLFAGAPVGKIDNGAVYRFVGAWQEKKGNEITWPAASRGQPLVFQAVVTAAGQTVKRNWSIRVR
jgi:hypothetical protein